MYKNICTQPCIHVNKSRKNSSKGFSSNTNYRKASGGILPWPWGIKENTIVTGSLHHHYDSVPNAIYLWSLIQDRAQLWDLHTWLDHCTHLSQVKGLQNTLSGVPTLRQQVLMGYTRVRQKIRKQSRTFRFGSLELHQACWLFGHASCQVVETSKEAHGVGQTTVSSKVHIRTA